MWYPLPGLPVVLPATAVDGSFSSGAKLLVRLNTLYEGVGDGDSAVLNGGVAPGSRWYSSRTQLDVFAHSCGSPRTNAGTLEASPPRKAEFLEQVHDVA